MKSYFPSTRNSGLARMKTVTLAALAVNITGVFLFFTLTAPSDFDFLMACPEGHYVENLFCYPEYMMVDTAAYDWTGRIMMMGEPVVFEDPSGDFEYPTTPEK